MYNVRATGIILIVLLDGMAFGQRRVQLRRRLPAPGRRGVHRLHSCPSRAKSEAKEYLQVGPTEIRYSIA